jgi:hypothetical protein
MEKAIILMKAEVEKWKGLLLKSAEGQDAAYARQVQDAILAVDGVFALMDQVDEKNAWIKSALTFTITGICGGDVFTKRASAVLTGLSKGLQVVVFESAEEMAMLMGRAEGRS